MFLFLLKIRACVLAVVVFCVHGLMWQVQGDSAIASFDPYIILNVDRGATDKQIKKAYKLKVRDAHSKRAVAVCCFLGLGAAAAARVGRPRALSGRVTRGCLSSFQMRGPVFKLYLGR